MEISIVLVKLAGAVLLVWTLYSIYRHVMDIKAKRREDGTDKEVQSLSEIVLNSILLYLWLAFMLVFSIGMIVNN
ncbi:MAG: hypothetical protein GF350_13945 [Chitinivibrionales bacterium]|nr:hypothetical protein [Chitinivibrionales bacterium]